MITADMKLSSWDQLPHRKARSAGYRHRSVPASPPVRLDERASGQPWVFLNNWCNEAFTAPSVTRAGRGNLLVGEPFKNPLMHLCSLSLSHGPELTCSPC